MSNTEPTPEELDAALADIETEVSQSEDVERSASLLIGRLSEQITQIADEAEAAATDPDTPETPDAESPVLGVVLSKLRALSERLDASQGSLGAAILAGTPADPTLPDAGTPAVTQEAVDQALADGTVVVPLEHAVPVVEAAIADGTLQAAGTQTEAPSNQTTSGDKPAGEWDPSDVEPGDGVVTDNLGVQGDPVVSIPDAADDAATKNDGETQPAPTE